MRTFGLLQLILPYRLVLTSIGWVGLCENVDRFSFFARIGFAVDGHQFVAFRSKKYQREHGAHARSVYFGKIGQGIINGLSAFRYIIGHLVEAVAVIGINKISQVIVGFAVQVFREPVTVYITVECLPSFVRPVRLCIEDDGLRQLKIGGAAERRKAVVVHAYNDVGIKGHYRRDVAGKCLIGVIQSLSFSLGKIKILIIHIQ